MSKKVFYIALVGALFIVQAFFLSSGGADGTIDVINGDGRGYYDYLTSIFLDHDLADQPVNGRYIVDVDGSGLNKYFSGTALLMLPFFLLGYLMALIGGSAIDGMSLPFQWSMCFAAIFYCTLGVYYLIRLLESIGIDSRISWVIALLVVFGTNLLYYSTIDLTASHVYSFFSISAFAWYSRSFFRKGRPKDFIRACLMLGVVILIRPVNGLVLLAIPFLAGSNTVLLGQLKASIKLPKMWAIGLLGVVAISLFQLIFYKLQTGNWIVWSYANEGFYFSSPAFWEFLFSFKRGWFIYSPIFLLTWIGFGKLWVKEWWKALWFGVFFVALVYVLSSWWSWHYGGSYGSRVMIDFYAIMVIPMAWFINGLRIRSIRLASLVFGCACVVLTFIQTHQIQTNIMSSWHMNTSKFFWTFGKLDATKYAGLLGGRDDTKPYHTTQAIIYEGEMKDHDGHWRANYPFKDSVAVFDESREFNLGFKYSFEDQAFESYFLEFDWQYTLTQPAAVKDAYVVIEVWKGDVRTHYDAFRLADRPDEPDSFIRTQAYRYRLPNDAAVPAQLKVYVWNKGLKKFRIEDPHMRILGLR